MQQRPVQTFAEHPDATNERHARALAEIQRMRDDHSSMQSQLASSHRAIDQLTNKVEMLESDKANWRNNAMLFQRKLIRLAAAMAGIGKLASDADEIVRSSREAEEIMDEEEKAAAKQAQKREVDQAGDAIGGEIVSLLRGAGQKVDPS
jgi:chromosome segregation ATPase